MRATWSVVVLAACVGAAPPAAVPDPDGTAAQLDAVTAAALADLAADLGRTPRGPRLDPAVRYRVPPPTGAPAAPAPVVIDYFFELACPYCAEERGALAAVTRRYGDRVAVVGRAMIVHGAPALAAHLVACAAAVRGSDIQEALWRGAFATGDYTSGHLLDLARAAGVAPAEVLGALADGRCAARIRADTVAARGFGVRGTPTLFVNGVPAEGLTAEPDLSAAVAAELARWDAAAAGGQSVADFHASWWSTARDPR